ncbi:MAG TPA: pirin family protein [Epulopiscium sp.]|nr:pirin family protein [Candidatus Epulonipiscium sp.]
MSLRTLRTINKIITGTHTQDGAGVKLVRVISKPDIVEFDPFLMLDAFDSVDPEDYTKGFPWHPHRGIETVTYLIKGNIEHEDSLGNKGSILDGGCQWMNAGGGILHQEMPKASDRMLGVQLWLNLPAKNKMVDPQYHDITDDVIPVIREDGNEVRIISGHYKGIAGATQGDYVKMTFLDVVIKAGNQLEIAIPKEEKLFIYIVEGAGWFDETDWNLVEAKSAILFDKGETLLGRASKEGIRFLLFSAKPLEEPIAWGGPIVMNTKEELDQAFREIKDGTFIKSK